MVTAKKTGITEPKQEVLAGWRSLIFFLVTTAFFVVFIYQGKGIEAYWTWALTCTAWLGKNYFSSRLNK